MFLDRCSIKVLTETVQVYERNRFPPRASNHPNTYADPARRHRQIGHTGIDRASDSRTHRRQPVVVYENAAHGLPYTHTDRMLADIVAFAGA